MAVKVTLHEDIEKHTRIWAAIRDYVVETLPDGRTAILRTDFPAGTYEYVGFEPTREEFDDVARIALADERRVLTIIGEDMTACREMAAGHGFDILAEEALMTTALVEAYEESDKTAAFVKDVDVAQMGIAQRCKLTVTTAEEEGGRPAASGQVGVQGEMAVFDRIKTEEDMRRRGLGSLLMGRLGAEAYKLGARTGWLIGTWDGQQLYGHLGWTPRYRVLVFGNKNAIQNP